MAGSFIGVVTTSIGFGMVLYALLTPIYESVHPSVSTGGFMPAAAILVVGGALWYYRWWLRGTEPTTPPMRFYATTVSWASLVTAIATVATVISSVLIFVFDSTEDAGFFFRFLPAAISVLGVALGVWAVHHPRLKNQVDSLRSYEYLMAASGLIAVVASGTVMTTFALRDASFIEGGRRSGVLAAFTALVIAATTWWWFWSGRQRAERPTEAQSRPRRTYVIAMAVVAGLAAAEALIAVLVIAFQGLFGLSPNTTTLATQAALAILAGAATTHLLLTNRDDQRHLAAKTVELPTFDVTIVCTDLGMLESLLPDEASLTVIGRGDQKGYISDEMAARIAEAVGRNRSIIWVEDGQFRIAPQPTSDDTTTSPDTVPTSPS